LLAGTLGQSSIGSVTLTSSTASDTCNGGVFYMTGKQQLLSFSGSLISDVSAKGKGGIIYS